MGTRVVDAGAVAAPVAPRSDTVSALIGGSDCTHAHYVVGEIQQLLFFWGMGERNWLRGVTRMKIHPSFFLTRPLIGQQWLY